MDFRTKKTDDKIMQFEDRQMNFSVQTTEGKDTKNEQRVELIPNLL